MSGEGEPVGLERGTVLVADGDGAARALAAEALRGEFRVAEAASSAEARAALAADAADAADAAAGVDIAVIAHDLPGGGGELARWLAETRPGVGRVLAAGGLTLEDAADWLDSGLAQRVLAKPLAPGPVRRAALAVLRDLLLERSHVHLLEELRRANIALEERVQERTRELEAANCQLHQRNQLLQRLALTDSLTGLPNRRGTDRLARTELLRRMRTRAPLTLGLIDVDHFKAVNSRHLHSGGDHALIWVARLLAQAVRAVDTVGRVGGEEFMLVAPDTGLAGAAILCERLRHAVADATTEYNGLPIRLTVSIGAVALEGDAFAGYDDVRQRAAELLRRAKDAGRDRCVVEHMPRPAPG